MKIHTLSGEAIAHTIDAVIAEDVASAIVTQLVQGRRGSTAIATTSELRKRLSLAMDDLDEALRLQSKLGYVSACSKIAALAVLLLVCRRMDTGSPARAPKGPPT